MDSKTEKFLMQELSKIVRKVKGQDGRLDQVYTGSKGQALISNGYVLVSLEEAYEAPEEVEDFARDVEGALERGLQSDGLILNLPVSDLKKIAQIFQKAKVETIILRFSVDGSLTLEPGEIDLEHEYIYVKARLEANLDVFDDLVVAVDPDYLAWAFMFFEKLKVKTVNLVHGDMYKPLVLQAEGVDYVIMPRRVPELEKEVKG